MGHKFVHHIALDFSSKALDIQSSILVCITANFPASDDVYNWSVNFSSDRQHQTKADYRSEFKHITASITRASGLAQWLAFLMHLILSSLEQFDIQVYADDTYDTYSHTIEVWNSLPRAVQSSESLDIFRRRLKTELFERSYNWYRAFQTTLLLRDSLSLSRSFLLWLQPWSLSTTMLLWHSFLKIIIIIGVWISVYSTRITTYISDCASRHNLKLNQTKSWEMVTESYSFRLIESR